MTAEKFIKKNKIPSFSNEGGIGVHYVKNLMVEFAKLKVQECKEAIHNNAYVEFIDDETGEPFDYTDVLIVDKISVQVNPDSILNTYDLEEIKL